MPGIVHIVTIENGYLAFLIFFLLFSVYTLDGSPQVFGAYRTKWEKLYKVSFPYLFFPTVESFPQKESPGQI